MQTGRRTAGMYWGVVLIVFGALMLVQQVGPTQMPGWWFLGILGLPFAIAYAQTRRHGWLIPAAIFFGLAGGMAVEGDGALRGAGVLGGLGLGFVAIPIVEWFVTRRAYVWPLVPGAVLLLIATLLESGNVALLATLNWLWPVVLIALGGWILYRYWREGAGKGGRQT